MEIKNTNMLRNVEVINGCLTESGFSYMWEQMFFPACPPPNSEVTPSQCGPVFSPTNKREDWSPRRFYKTMRYIFRPDSDDPDGLVEIPFRLNRELSHAEFRGCAEHFINARRNEFLDQLLERQQGRSPESPLTERWPDLEGLGLSLAEFWNYEIPLGQLYFAETRQKQAHARHRVKMLAQRGPIRVRQMLKNVVLKTPQAGRQFSGLDLLELVEDRAERQFMWAFLRKESGLNREGMRNANLVKDAAQALADAYSYLHLEPAAIAEGLRNPHQADKDNAEEFGISENSVRSLLSKFVRR